jgi:hypothetical protein
MYSLENVTFYEQYKNKWKKSLWRNPYDKRNKWKNLIDLLCKRVPKPYFNFYDERLKNIRKDEITLRIE